MSLAPTETLTLELASGLCGDVEQALRREWLVTNGIGGFASGTIAGALTRRYHGLLLAALRPPLGRTLLVAKLDETATAAGRDYPLYTNVWRDGIGQVSGCRWLCRFELDLGAPTWHYEFANCRLTKRIWMEPGRNTTYVQYVLDQRSGPLVLSSTLLVNSRDYHALRRRDDTRFVVDSAESGLRLRTSDSGAVVRVCCFGNLAAPAEWVLDHTWYRDFRLPVEQARGFDYLEDHLCAGRCRVAMQPGQTLTFVLSAEAAFDSDRASALERRRAAAAARLEASEKRTAGASRDTPTELRQLVLAADQFIVARPMEADADGHTVIAGYPWFTDWGRDTMIALPGLTLCTGRPDVARQVLRTWARYVDRGMIPNRFPDRGIAPEYHTADATLWFLWAIDQYMRASEDRETLAELFPVMQEIVAWHRSGTRHNIRVGDDGLVHAGEEGVNLTWMDAKIGERVITPRSGKPVELSALWYDGLCNLARLAERLGKPPGEYERLAACTRRAFERFWNAERGGCYDVLDGPAGHDAVLRPNQIFAVSLEHSPLSAEQQRAVVAVCERELLTPFGLRSLGPREPGYHGRCVGDPVARDEAYHQGTVWGWLLGPFVIAHYRVHRDAQQARRLLEPMLGQLRTHGVGSLSEIFDGDPPHEPRGCIAQAWSVAETLRALMHVGLARGAV